MTDAGTELFGAGVRRRLRLATADLHQRVEKQLDLDRDMRRDDYVSLLARFFGLYAPFEQVLSELDWTKAGLDFEARRKLPWIAADLADFGLDAAARAGLPQCGKPRQPGSIPAALGALYVIEGSTLGGQLILRRLGPKLGLSPSFGGRFFASYGADVSSMWRAFVVAVEHHGAAEPAAAEIEAAAIDSFLLFDAWFAGLGRGGATIAAGGANG